MNQSMTALISVHEDPLTPPHRAGLLGPAGDTTEAV